MITYYKDNEGLVGTRPINMENENLELKDVQGILSQSNKEIRFLSSPASVEKFGSALDLNPLIIHFCGHGVKNNAQNFGLKK